MFLVSSTVLLLGIFGVSELPKLNQLCSAYLEATVCLKKHGFAANVGPGVLEHARGHFPVIDN